MEEDKEFSGFSPSPEWTTPGPRNSPILSPGSKAKWNEDMEKVLMNTGNSYAPLRRKLRFEESRPCLGLDVMPSFQEALQQSPTYQKKTQELTGLLNLEPNPFNETVSETGNLYGNMPKKGRSKKSLPTYEWCLIGHFGQLRPIMTTLNLINEPQQYITAQLGRASHVLLGPTHQLWQLTLRTLVPSSSAVTKVKQMLSWTNLEEVLMSRTSSGGLTNIRYAWKLKGHHVPLSVFDGGSPPICIQENGTQTSTQPLSPRLCDD